MTVYKEFCEVAMAVDDIYDTSLIFDEDTGKIVGYHCPHCGEPIYFEDWEDNYIQYPATITTCPICCEDLEV